MPLIVKIFLTSFIVFILSVIAIGILYEEGVVLPKRVQVGAYSILGAGVIGILASLFMFIWSQ